MSGPSPGTIKFKEIASSPSAPDPGYAVIYIKTDNVIYVKDSSGTEIPLGTASGITSLTGDVTGTGPGAAATTVAFVGGQTASNVAAAVVSVGAATSASTPLTLVERDGSGNFSAHNITANAFIGNLTGNAATATAAVTAISFTGTLNGDVTGTQAATVVSYVGGKTSTDVANATTEVDNATSANTASTLVLRDASGNFAANSITANLTGNVTGNVSGSSSTFTGSLSGDVTGTQSATAIASTIVTGKVLTGFSVGSNTPILATDSILQAFEKTQGQLDAASGASITGLTGDVTATGPGNVPATVAYVGGKTASDVANATATVDAATSSNTPSTLVLRDGSGGFSAGTIASTQSNVTGAADVVQVTIKGNATQTHNILVVKNSANAPLFTVDNSGNGVFTGTLSASNLSGTNTGDVTLTAVGSSPNANGASLSGQALTLQPADGTNPGLLTSIAQTIGGVKTFNSAPNFNSLTASQALVLDGSKNVTSLTYTPSNSNSTLASRDSAGNSSFNNVIVAVTEVASAGQTINMNYGSAGHQRVTGTATVTFNLPDATYMTNGEQYRFNNLSTQPITINKNDGSTLVYTVPAGGLAEVTCIDNSTTNGQWDPHPWLAVNATSGTAGTSLPGNLSVAGTISASNFSGSSSGTNTGDVTVTNTNSINLAFTSGQTGLNATLNLSSDAADANNIKATTTIHTNGLHIEYPYAAPVQIGTSNNSGSATSIALSDHVHAHGAQTDPTLHVVATHLANGFMSSTDKIKLDAIISTGATDAQILISDGTNFNARSVSGDTSLTDTGATKVLAIQNVSVASTAPTDAQILVYNNGTSKWTPASVSSDININDTGSATIQANVVSNSKLAQMPANTLKGNNTGSTANAADLTVSQVNMMLGTVTTVGTFDSQTSQANGLDIIGNILYAQSATTSNPGMVNATTQSFAGNKTFTGTVNISSGSTSALVINSTALVVDATNSAVGIGTAPASGTIIDAVNSSGTTKAVQLTGYGSNVGVRGRYANGTAGSPTAAVSGNILEFISGRGYGATGFSSVSTGRMDIIAGETFTDTSMATYLTFSTTPTTSVTALERLRINSTGRVLINTTTDNGTDQLQVNGSESVTAINLSGTAGAGYINYIPQSSAPSAPASGYKLYGDASGRLAWKGTNGYQRIFDGTSNTADRTYTLPDTSDQIATAQMTTAFKTAVVALTYGANIATDASLGNVFTVTLTGGANLSAPTNPVNGQKITYRITQDATGGRVLTFDAIFNFGTSQYNNTQTANKTDYIGCMYNSSTVKWDVLTFAKSF